MNITIYHSEISDVVRRNSLEQLLQSLPPSLQKKANRYRSELSAFNYVVGRLLLKRGLNDFGMNSDLEQIQFEENGKPTLPQIHFNISHSDQQVICGFSKEGLLGVDLEKIKPIDFEDFTAMFSDKEWAVIKSASDPLEKFYWYWTRKESIIKALGWNLAYLHQIELDVTLDYFIVEGKRWFLRDVEVGDGYLGAVCCELEIESFKMIELDFK